MRTTRVAVVMAGTTVAILLSGAVALYASTQAVTLTADKAAVTYPAAVTLIAQVAEVTSDTPTNASLEVRPADANYWTLVGAVGGFAESDTGRYAFVVPPNKKTSAYRVRIGTDVSEPTTVTIHVPMGKPVASSVKVKAGKPLGLKGTIRPTHPVGTEMTLTFQRYDTKTKKWKAAGSRSASITRVIDNDMTQWSTSVATTKSDVGSWRVKSFHECIRHAPSDSAWTSFAVVK